MSSPMPPSPPEVELDLEQQQAARFEKVELEADPNPDHASSLTRTGQDTEDESSSDETLQPLLLVGSEHPFNWPKYKKWSVTLQAAFMMFCSTITSSAPAGGSDVFREFLHIGATETNLLVSMFLIGYSVGPFVTAPTSEAYGRKWPSVISAALYTVFNGACAACNNIAPLLVCRFLAGCCASGPVTISGSIVSDVWRPKDRGMVMSIWSVGSFAGPALGPIVGGYISTSSLHIRWIFIVLTILSAVMGVSILVALPETYVPRLIQLKSARLYKETGDVRYLSAKKRGKLQALKSIRILLTRPFSMFICEPILILSTIYSAFSYSILYLLFPLYPIIFGQIHGLPPGKADLPFLATLGGVIIAIPITYYYQIKYRKDLQKNDGKHTPELRLPMANLGGAAMLVALLWLGWSGYRSSVPPVVPALSGLFTGIASVLLFRSFTNYVIEVYKDYSASAVAALVVFRSLFGAGLPLAVPSMVDAMGVQWAATLLAGVQILLLPVPFLFFRYGKAIRQNSTYGKD